jgi:hypothetical protein
MRLCFYSARLVDRARTGDAAAAAAAESKEEDKSENDTLTAATDATVDARKLS